MTENDSRSPAPSNSVVKSLAIGGPAGVVLGYLQAVISTKYGVPAEVVGAGFGLVITGVMGSLQYFTRGGRKGEPG